MLTRREFLLAGLATPCFIGLTERLSLAEDLREGAVEPTVEEALAAIRTLTSTAATSVTAERRAACDVIQNSVDRLRAAEFEEYFKSSPEEAKRWEDERAVLRFLNASFDKVLAEFRETTVADGGVVLWQIYNMGYLVKTPTQSFAIDVKHRRAPEHTPLIDFLLVTHKHGDHYTDAFCDSVASAGKPVVTNFIDNEWKTPEEGREYRFGDCSIKTRLVDHNDRLRKFVTTYEIDCGERSSGTTILHVGDACNVGQLVATKPIDVFIPHLAVGLDVPKAVNETIRPKTTLLSHILELGHLIDKWRWSYQYGFNICEKCSNDSVILPVWGEKYEARQ